MSVYAHRNPLLPTTPVQPHQVYFGEAQEPAIVDYSTHDFDYARPPFSSSISYSGYLDQSPLYAAQHDSGALVKQEPHPYPSTVDLSLPAPHSVIPVTMNTLEGDESDVMSQPELPSAVPVDMNMAKPGTVSAAPGFLTPIATHVAALAAWFWFSPRPTPFTSSPTASPTTSTSAPAEPSTPALNGYGSINPLQVQVPVAFKSFVERLLQVTSVSHSVVLISLLYLSRLTHKHGFCGPRGTENGAFVVSLMLANKYLDDNTYTNRTWAELSLIAIGEINRLECHFLSGLEYNLKVEQADFNTWSKFLDGFLLSHQRQNQRHYAITNTEAAPSYPSTHASTETSREPPRARSHSPRETSSEPSGGSNISPTTGRKRSAGDAFQIDGTANPEHEQAVKSMRVPSRRGYVHLPGATQQHQPTYAGTLGRASSLSRAGRTSAQAERRGSTPGFSHHQALSLQYPAPVPVASQPRIVPRAPAIPLDIVPQDDGWGIPRGPPVPPEHLVFYTLAAEAHPGQDGSRRKATLHYQVPQTQYAQPSQYPAGQQQQAINGQAYPAAQSLPGPVQYQTNGVYASQPLTPSYMAPATGVQPQSVYTPSGTPVQVGRAQEYMSSALTTPAAYGPGPSQQYAFGQPAVPAPAQFANAGPPAYQYQPDGYDAEMYRILQQQLHHQQQQQPLPTTGIPLDYPFAPTYPQHVQLMDLQAGWGHGVGPNTAAAHHGYHAHHHNHARAMMQSRSEWSSPMPEYGPF